VGQILRSPDVIEAFSQTRRLLSQLRYGVGLEASSTADPTTREKQRPAIERPTKHRIEGIHRETSARRMGPCKSSSYQSLEKWLAARDEVRGTTGIYDRANLEPLLLP
jgi:hypothetical protein